MYNRIEELNGGLKTKDELGEELCMYCPLSDELDEVPPPPTPSNPMGCEGAWCDQAYERYTDRQE